MEAGCCFHTLMGGMGFMDYRENGGSPHWLGAALLSVFVGAFGCLLIFIGWQASLRLNALQYFLIYFALGNLTFVACICMVLLLDRNRLRKMRGPGDG